MVLHGGDGVLQPPPWLVGSAPPEDVEDGGSRRERWEEGGQQDTDRQRGSRYQGWTSVWDAWGHGVLVPGE